MIAATLAVVVIILMVSIGLSIVQFRRMTRLVFWCLRCGIEFEQAPHRDFPRECPSCRARDWNV